MEYKEYIQKRIENLKESNTAFKRLSLVLLTIGVLFIFLPLCKCLPDKLSSDYVQFGFGIINMLIPIYLQDLISKRKSQIIDLELINSKLPDLALEETVMKKLLEKL